MSSTETITTALGTFEAHPAHLTTTHGTPVVMRTYVLPDDGVTINGITYTGNVQMMVYPRRGYATLDADMVQRADQSFSWGSITDSARDKVRAALVDAGEEAWLVGLAGSPEWRRERVEEEVRRAVLSEVRSAYRNAYRTAHDLGERESVDADTIAREVLLSLTADDLTAY